MKRRLFLIRFRRRHFLLSETGKKKLSAVIFTVVRMYRAYEEYLEYVERPAPGPTAPPVSKFSNEVFNPTNPVELPISGFGNGHRLRVVLKTLDKRNEQFSVNLKNGNDILLHFNPRLKDNVIVFNSFSNGEWQHEERPSIVFPFERKKIYTIEFVATTDSSALVNLKDGDDILLHFNPRLKDEVIVFNVFTDGEWQHEERPSIVFPFQKDQIYTIELVATTDNSALIYVNGRFLYEFRQRESGQRASSVEVDGDVFIHSVHVT
ncbi:galactoside-binding lectin [Necator americanus]|uniref:Galectin n=1 Tax=Necator americanus TaxID=51031 RepID=W2TJZ4_NECAM|nr:galactoside-binding lectin [Necator americanus]ETN82400.1 galactoside-binding lectin [Necator americanus]